jgi:hypothetical protein
MNTKVEGAVRPKIISPLHADLVPAVLWNRAYRDAAATDGRSIPLVVGLERGDGSISRYQTMVFPAGHLLFEAGLRHAERLVKSLLWMWGGHKVYVGGPADVGDYIRKAYSRKGERAFDADLMSTAYDKKFTVEVTVAESVPQALEKTRPLGRHLEG